MKLSTLLVVLVINYVHAADFVYNLDVESPSFILYGSDLRNGSTVDVRIENAIDFIQVNALFGDLNRTSFMLRRDVQGYTNFDLADQGPRGLRLIGPNISLIMSANSSNDFYLSFTLVQDGIDTADLGFDSVTISSFELTTSFPPFYQILADRQSAAMLTIINKKYSTASCYDFDMTNLQIVSCYQVAKSCFSLIQSGGCSIRMYAGGPPGALNSTAYLMEEVQNGDQNFVMPTFSAAYYTFVVDKGCAAAFNLMAHSTGTVNLNPGPHSHGFVASCDFPGRRFSRKEAVNPFQLNFHATGISTIPIQVIPQFVEPGTNGQLGMIISEQGQTRDAQNFTQSTNQPSQGTGHDLTITWQPGSTGRKGLLMKFTYKEATTDYFYVDKDPLILDSTLWASKEKEIRAPGSYIQVNVKILVAGGGNVIFSDATHNFSVSDIQQMPRVFTDYVRLSQKTGNISYLAAFTSFNTTQQQSSYGLNEYTLVYQSADNPVPISMQSKNVTQAVTMIPMSFLPLYIGSINMTTDCEADLFASGIPSDDMKNRMRLYTFSSTKAKNFACSAIRSPAATLLIPANCQFDAVITFTSDGTDQAIQFGGSGFFMSQDYPPGYANYYPNPVQPTNGFSLMISQDAKIRPPFGRFAIKVPYADPGTNSLGLSNGGNLSISVISSKDYHQTNTFMNIVTMTGNKSITADGFLVEINWSPVTGSTGFLMTYDMGVASSSATNQMIQALFIILAYFY